MNFEFSDDQLMLRDEARRFLTEQCGTEVVRKVLDGAEPYDRDLWHRIAELGWLGIGLPEEHGGYGGALELCILAEELGRAVAPLPVASTLYLATRALLLGGSAAQQAAWLPGIAAGERIGAWALTERRGSQLAQRPDCHVAGGKLYGVKTPVADGAFADFAIVSARRSAAADAPLGLYVVALDDASVRRTPLTVIDPTRPCAALEFNGAPAEPLDNGGDYAALVGRVVDGAATLLAFEQLGGAETCLSMARDFTLERKAFGRPIAGFQAVKHRLADMYVKNQLARGNAYYAACALADDGDDLPLAAAAARISATDAFEFASQESIQLHGGMGYTWEVDCHLYYRRSRALALVVGSAREWKERLTSLLIARRAAAVSAVGTAAVGNASAPLARCAA